MTTNEAALLTRGASQLYLSLGDANNDGSIAIRLYYKPLVMLIWLGAVVMMLAAPCRCPTGAARRRARPAANPCWLRRSRVMRRLAFTALLLALAAPAYAVTPEEMLKDPAQEARARDLSQELRCMVCQNQSIDDSDARSRTICARWCASAIKAGDSDKQVLDYLVARYGEFVLLRPRFELHTLLLWGLARRRPARRYYRTISSPYGAGPSPRPPALSAEERRKLASLVEGAAIKRWLYDTISVPLGNRPYRFLMRPTGRCKAPVSIFRLDIACQYAPPEFRWSCLN